MFQIQDAVIYGQHGVCKVTDIGTLSMSMVDKNKQYYTLVPVYRQEAVVYAPVENQRIVMRPVLTKAEAEALIERIPKIETAWILNEKAREQQYKEAMQTCDCEELIKIIKTLYIRKKERIESGKKVTVVDEKYFRQAEEKLYGELAYVLEMDRSKVGAYITQRMEKNL